MIREGLWLMVIGMSGVLIFLLLLVGLMQASGRVWVVLDRWLPPPAPASAGASASAGPTSGELDEERARIALAVALARAAQDSARATQGRSSASGEGRT